MKGDTQKSRSVHAIARWRQFSLGTRLFLGSSFASLFYTWLPGLGILGFLLYRITYFFLWPYLQFALALLQITGFDVTEMRRIASGGPVLLIALKGKLFAFYYFIGLVLLSYGMGYIVTMIRNRLQNRNP